MKPKLRTLRKKCLKAWSLKIRRRDNYKCIWCHKRSKLNHAHHIVSKALINPYGLFDLNNGFTLCYRCHIYRLKSEVDEYISIRDSYLTEKDLTYNKLRLMYNKPVKFKAEDYLYKLKELNV